MRHIDDVDVVLFIYLHSVRGHQNKLLSFNENFSVLSEILRMRTLKQTNMKSHISSEKYTKTSSLLTFKVYVNETTSFLTYQLYSWYDRFFQQLIQTSHRWLPCRHFVP